jgi:hypothetical protein
MSAEPVAAAAPALEGWLADSRRRSGVPRKVTDTDALLTVAHRLLAAPAGREQDGPRPAPDGGEGP